VATTLNVRLPRGVVERLEREAKKLGMGLEEYVLELLIQGLDPSVRAKEYIETSRELLEQVREELGKGDVRQAAEKAWGAAALVVKAYAEWRERRRLTSHGELWEYKRVIEKELGGWVHDAWMNAVGMHVCFYEGWCSEDDVEKALKRIRRLVEEIASKVEA